MGTSDKKRRNDTPARVIVKRVNAAPGVEVISKDNRITLEPMQRIVGGPIEAVRLNLRKGGIGLDLDLWINEEGLGKLPLNFRLPDGVAICGDVFFARYDAEGNTTSTKDRDLPAVESFLSQCTIPNAKVAAIEEEVLGVINLPPLLLFLKRFFDAEKPFGLFIATRDNYPSAEVCGPDTRFVFTPSHVVLIDSPEALGRVIEKGGTAAEYVTAFTSLPPDQVPVAFTKARRLAVGGVAREDIAQAVREQVRG